MTSDLLKEGSFLKLKDQYLVDKFLIAGGFSDVYTGIRVKDSKKVIIKVLRNIDFDDHIQAENYWRRECAFIDIGSFFSPLTMKLLDSMADKRNFDHFKFILVTNFIEGPEFGIWYEKWIKNAPSGIEQITFLLNFVFIPLCEHLQFCSNHGLIHRDFSTTNFIMSTNKDNGQVYPVIIDWGAGRNFDPATLYDNPPYIEEMEGIGTQIYTPGFSSPEVMEGKPPVPQTDIYNFGSIMYFAFSGGKYRKNDILTTDYILNPREEVEDCPKLIANIVKRCTQYQPRDRYITFNELLEDLNEVYEQLSEETTSF
ncbi:protein kinase domain-containing protein [Candidatus Lokiarchaeum ossiferum]|uniref:protein kinase domain-containing protein n=1 Tax=Candidatus Lokiarchaeum ossiferum TaxID=2951803 RepID=UPI00352BD8F4